MKTNKALVGMWFITDDTLHGKEFFKSSKFGKVLFFVNEDWVMVQEQSAEVWITHSETALLHNKLYNLQDMEEAFFFKEEKECKTQLIAKQIRRLESSDYHKAAKKKEYINDLEKLLKTLE